MNHFTQRTISKGSTSLQHIRDGVVVRAQTTLQYLGEDMKGAIEVPIEEEGFDYRVAYAKCGVLIYYGPHLDIRVKSYGSLNLLGTTMSNFEHLDIFWSTIRHPSKKLWQFEFVKKFRVRF